MTNKTEQMDSLRKLYDDVKAWDAELTRLQRPSIEDPDKMSRLLYDFLDVVKPLVEQVEGPDDEAFLAAARARYQVDGELEFDDDAVVSQSDDGAYVSGWRWVYNDEAGVDPDTDDEEDEEVPDA